MSFRNGRIEYTNIKRRHPKISIFLRLNLSESLPAIITPEEYVKAPRAPKSPSVRDAAPNL